MADPAQSLQGIVYEEGIELVRPLKRKDRIMVLPENRRGRREAFRGRRFSLCREGDDRVARQGAIPIDRSDERAGRRVDFHQVIYPLVIDYIIRPRPMRPEVTKISTDCITVSVDELPRQVELVK